jgi:hypothetical protein
MVFQPQGIGGGVVNADAVEDDYIAKFKALDPKVVRLFTSAELMVNAGLLTVDDVAKYIDANANILVSTVVLYCNSIFSTSFSASLLGSENMSASTAKAILSDAGMPADRAQSILYSMVSQGFYNKLLDIITLDASDASYTSNTTLSTGVNRYRSLSIASGITLTLGASPGVIIAYSVTNSGTIASGWVKGAGGSAGASGAGAGGGGKGAVIIFASNMNVGTVTANGANGGNGSTVSGYGTGGDGSAGNFWLISGDAVPNGGNGGGNYGVGLGKPNGGGGGGTYSGSGYWGGKGGTATTTTFTSGTSLLQQLFKAVCDWWLVNVVGKSPTSTISIPSLGGSGGGGGGAVDGYSASGGGGGGGGQIIIYGTSITAGTVQANGGNGGNGGNEGTDDCGGGGGGGGIIYVFYKSLTGTNTFSVSGGARGEGDLRGTAGGAGIGREIAV